MFISIASIFSFFIIGLLLLSFFLEKKGYFLNKKVSNYLTTLKIIMNTETKLQEKEILETAQLHLASEYKSYKKSSSPLNYTKDLIENASNYDVVKSWCYLFINYKLKQPVFLENDTTKETKRMIISICEKKINPTTIPASFLEYFN